MVRLWEDKVLLGTDLYWRTNRLVDNTSNNAVGYCFLDEPGNISQLPSKDSEPLLDAILASQQLKARFVIEMEDGSVMWNVMEWKKWLDDLSKLKLLILTMAHLVGGAPARGTEWTCLTLRNTETQEGRGLYLMDDAAVAVVRYTKTTSRTGHDRLIPHTLDAHTGIILVQMLILTDRLSRWVALKAYGQEAAALWARNLFVCNDRLYTTDDLSREIGTWYFGALGFTMGVADYRQIFAAFAKQLFPHFGLLETEEDIESLTAMQMGNSRQTFNRMYGVAKQIGNLPPDVFHVIERISKDWQAYSKVIPGGERFDHYREAGYQQMPRLIKEGLLKYKRAEELYNLDSGGPRAPSLQMLVQALAGEVEEVKDMLRSQSNVLNSLSDVLISKGKLPWTQNFSLGEPIIELDSDDLGPPSSGADRLMQHFGPRGDLRKMSSSEILDKWLIACEKCDGSPGIDDRLSDGSLAMWDALFTSPEPQINQQSQGYEPELPMERSNRSVNGATSPKGEEGGVKQISFTPQDRTLHRECVTAQLPLPSQDFNSNVSKSQLFGETIGSNNLGRDQDEFMNWVPSEADLFSSQPVAVMDLASTAHSSYGQSQALDRLSADGFGAKAAPNQANCVLRNLPNTSGSQVQISPADFPNYERISANGSALDQQSYQSNVPPRQTFPLSNPAERGFVTPSRGNSQAVRTYSTDVQERQLQWSSVSTPCGLGPTAEPLGLIAPPYTSIVGGLQRTISTSSLSRSDSSLSEIFSYPRGQNAVCEMPSSQAMPYSLKRIQGLSSISEASSQPISQTPALKRTRDVSSISTASSASRSQTNQYENKRLLSTTPLACASSPHELPRSKKARRNDNSAVAVHSLRSNMRAILGDPEAVWKSRTQMLATKALVSLERDLIVCLKTSGGKSLPVVLAAKAEDAITILFIPLTALLLQWREKLEESGVGYVQYHSPEDLNQYSDWKVLIVSPEKIKKDVKGWVEAVKQMSKRRVVAQVVVDEAHMAITNNGFRSSLTKLFNLRAGAIQVVLLTATIPVAAERELASSYGLFDYDMIRGDGVRPELRYVLQSAENIEMLKQIAEECCREIQMSPDWNEGQDRVIVFAKLTAGKDMAKRLGCPFYCAELGDQNSKKDVLNQFRSGVHKIIVATNGLAAGYDYAHVRLVIDLDASFDILDAVQMYSRAGRDGRKATALILSLGSGAPAPPPDAGDLTGIWFLQEIKAGVTMCIRCSLSEPLDGVGRFCWQYPEWEQCSECSKRYHLSLSQSQIPTYHGPIDGPFNGDDNFIPIANTDHWRQHLTRRFNAGETLCKELRTKSLQQENTTLQQVKTALHRFRSQCVVCHARGTGGVYHALTKCPRLPVNLQTYIDFKNKITPLNVGVCYTCHLPNMGKDKLHRQFVKGSGNCDTGNKDILAPLAICVWNSPELRASAASHFAVGSEWDSLDTFKKWLRANDVEEASFTRGLRLLVWYDQSCWSAAVDARRLQVPAGPSR